MPRIGLLKKFKLYREERKARKLEEKEKKAQEKEERTKNIEGWEAFLRDNPTHPVNLLRNKKKYTKDLAEGKFFPDATEDEWADAVVTMFQLDGGKDGKKDYHGLDIKIKLTPQEYLKYHALQTKIAENVKKENHRPTINLTVKGKHDIRTSFGIIGGTGPLSDAEMLKKTMEQLQKEQFDLEDVHIRLLSAPPPREDDSWLTTTKEKKYLRALNRTTAFTGEKHSKLALASNTAHLHLTGARVLRKLGRVRKRNMEGLSGDHQVQDLAGRVVEKVLKSGHNTPRPLILGTKEGYDKKLYPKKFEGTAAVAGTVSKDNAQRLQDWIDDTKQNGYNKKRADALIKYILEEVAEQEEKSGRPTHIILGCTELPLALDKTGLAQLEQALDGIEIIDTEEFFAEQYAEMVKENAHTAKGAETETEDSEEERLAEHERVASEVLAELKKTMAARRKGKEKAAEDEGDEKEQEEKQRRLSASLADYMLGSKEDLPSDLGAEFGFDENTLFKIGYNAAYDEGPSKRNPH